MSKAKSNKDVSCVPTVKLFKPRKTVLSVLLGVRKILTEYPERWVRGNWNTNRGGSKEVDALLACRHCAEGLCRVLADGKGGILSKDAIYELNNAARVLGKSDIVNVNDSKGETLKSGRKGVLHALEIAIKNVRSNLRARS